ncbi:MAG: hypothetical protein GDA56_19165 [Hormoscilla sp. GM7CHS1pb]|nr:hypothetical protein [Hormoscilla sp. GM7CHS1pb]
MGNAARLQVDDIRSLEPTFRETSETESEETSPKPDIPSLTLEEDPVQVVQAVRRSGRDRDRRPRYSLLTEYFPVTKREMKQTWRYRRSPVREGAL